MSSEVRKVLIKHFVENSLAKGINPDACVRAVQLYGLSRCIKILNRYITKNKKINDDIFYLQLGLDVKFEVKDIMQVMKKDR